MKLRTLLKMRGLRVRVVDEGIVHVLEVVADSLSEAELLDLVSVPEAHLERRMMIEGIRTRSSRVRGSMLL